MENYSSKSKLIKTKSLIKDLKLNNLILQIAIISFLLLVTLLSAKAQNDTILVNFGDTDPQGMWNTLSDAIEGNLSNLKNSKGEQTNIAVEIFDRFNGINQGGTKSPDPSTGFPSYATANSFFGSSSPWSGITEPTGGIKITGVDNNKEYTIVCISSRIGVTDNREVQIVVFGATSDTLYLDGAMNTSKIVSAKCNPFIAGYIKVTASPGPNNTNPTGFYYLNALKIIYSNTTTSILTANVAQNKINVYPNPSNGEVNIKVINNSEVNILDLSGKVLMKKMVNSGNNKINIDLNPGAYLLRVIGSDNSVTTTKFLVE